MLVINLALVSLVVVKQAMYPSNHDPCSAEEGEEPMTPLLATFKAGLMIMPIANGILLTLDNAFSPVVKRNALQWTAAKIESEIYTYRARACRYSPVNTSMSWSFASSLQGADTQGDTRTKHQQGRQIASKTFVDTISAVCNHLHTEGVFVASHLNYVDDHARRTRREDFLEKKEAQTVRYFSFLPPSLPLCVCVCVCVCVCARARACVPMCHNTYARAHMFSLFGSDYCSVTLEEVDTASELHAPRTVKYRDNGYALLDISQCLHRTIYV